jgi:hypothetical protein
LAPVCGRAWRIVPTPGQSASALTDVLALSPSSAWAVGNGSQGPFLLHWNGSTWVLDPAKTGPGFTFSGVGVSPNGGGEWAVGWQSPRAHVFHTLIENFRGKRRGWTVVPSPSPGKDAVLQAVATTGPHEAWAVGSFTPQRFQRPLILHWNGSVWARVSAPTPFAHDTELAAMAVVSQNDVWAVGDGVDASGVPHPLALHWNGSKWTVSPTEEISGHGLSLTAVSTPVAEGLTWAVGTSDAGKPIAERLAPKRGATGGKWSIVPTPEMTDAAFTGVSAPTRGSGWAVGWRSVNGVSRTLIEHWNGSRWSIVSSPNAPGADQLEAISANGVGPRPGAVVWAVGWSQPKGGSQRDLTIRRCPA